MFRSDRGGEYLRNDLKDDLKRHGIKSQQTMPYTPEQNGVAERKNRYLMEAVRTMLIDAKLPDKYWGEAVMTATYLQNRLPTSARSKTPFELWFNKKPDVQHLRAFGCRALAHIPKQKRTKLNVKTYDCVFLGYPEGSKGYKLLERPSGKIIASRDVTFLEESRAEGQVYDPCDSPTHHNTRSQQKPKETEQETIYFLFDSTEEVKIKRNIPTQPPNQGEAAETQPLNQGEAALGRSHSSRQDTEETPLISTHQYIYDNEHDGDEVEPKTYQEAINGPQREEWKKAMDEEIKSLEENDTWHLEPIPKGKESVGSKWVYKLKRTPDGNPDRFKARLVAQGFSQKYGVDYDEVFAPVVKATTIRTLLSIAGDRNYHVKHRDVKTAFLNGKFNENIYMKQPPGHVDEQHKDWAYKLNKSIYGLKQAVKMSNEALNEVLTNYGFMTNEDDACLYKHGNRTLTYLVVHVDDIIIASGSLSRINAIIKELNKEFAITDLGDIKCYLGMDVRRNQQGEFLINQSNYVEKILTRTKLEESKQSTYPMDTGYEKHRVNSTEIQSDSYRRLIGALLYISVNTRLDISAPVALLAQPIKDTKQTDWIEAQRICRYLKGTIQYELKLGNRQEADPSLLGYADANWAEDRETRKSNTGYIFKLFGGTISWTCRKQSCVTTASTEAEINALSEASKKCVAIRSVLEFLDEKQMHATTIYEDNQSCINNIHSEGKSRLTKHIDCKFLNTKELVRKKGHQVSILPNGDECGRHSHKTPGTTEDQNICSYDWTHYGGRSNMSAARGSIENIGTHRIDIYGGDDGQYNELDVRRVSRIE